MTPLPRPQLRAVIGLLAAGLLLRLLIVDGTDGVAFDMGSFMQVEAALREHGFGFYAEIHPSRWPYPPGYLPFVAFAGVEVPPLQLQSWIRLPAVLADVGLALVAQDLLGRLGGTPRQRVWAVALVALGPVFVGVSAFNGQLDPVATLFALAALWVWTVPGLGRRALYAGLLIGAGAAVKTVPGLMVLALAPTARSWRELVTLAASAAAVLAAAMGPFVLATPSEALRIFTYHGVPGFGGVSLLVQPDFPQRTLAGLPVEASDALLFMRDHGHRVVLLPALALLAGLFWWRRPDALTASVLLWLTVWAFGANFFLQYLVWGLPFLLARGHLVAAAAVQLGLSAALLASYNAPVPEGWALWAYTVPVVAFLVASVAAVVLLAARVIRRPAAGRAVPAAS